MTMESVTAQVMAAFAARVERELANMAPEERLAVSDFEANSDFTVTAEIIRLQPGERPPTGRKWTIYIHTPASLEHLKSGA